MEIRQLRYLLSVVRLGTVRAAAEEHYVTQPAVSIQLRKLETELGERLLERRKGRMVLTETGRAVAEHAEAVVRGLEALENTLAGLRGLKGGRLRVGNIDAASVYVLPAVYRTFRRHYPGVKIEIVVGDTAHLLEALRRGDVELATTTLPVDAPGFATLPIYREEMVLVADPKHVLLRRRRVMLSDVVAAGLITYPPRSVTRGLLERVFLDHGLPLNAIMEIASPEAIKRLTQAGLGVSILPRPVVAAEVRRGTLGLIPLGAVRFQRTIGMVMREGASLSPPARVFLDMVRAKFPAIDQTRGPQRHELRTEGR
jgi:DNA-binding transcriptional LysR family regulator